jgi:hypothetical protein
MRGAALDGVYASPLPRTWTRPCRGTERQLWVDIALSLRGGSVADGAAHVALVHTGGRAARPAAMASAAAKSTQLRAGPRGHTLALAVRGRSAMLGRSGVKPMAAASSDTFE